AGRSAGRRRRQQRDGRRRTGSGRSDITGAGLRPRRRVASHMTAASRIVVAADSPLAAARIEALLRTDPRVDVVISAPGQLTALATERAASVVILAMPAPSGARPLVRFFGVRRAP